MKPLETRRNKRLSCTRLDVVLRALWDYSADQIMLRRYLHEFSAAGTDHPALPRT